MAREMNARRAARRSNAKIAALLLVLILIVGVCVGGTVAWLIASPAPAVNTFTYGDINIGLTETDTQIDEDDNPNTNEYKMMPGEEIIKDPVITVKAESEEMWLFVKLDKSENFDTFMEYTMEAGWAALEGVDGVYYRHITAEEVADEDLALHVFANDVVTVKQSVTKDMLNALDSGSTANYPTLTVSACAVQYSGFEAATPAEANAAALNAWNAAQGE